MCAAGAAMAGENTGSYSNRSLGPDGTHGYWKEGDVVNTGGTSGKDMIFTGGSWVPKV
jgi:hypothetical protein|tara:strand:+ start:452 stop:625 length:174 start_codon:yes stop_codon:yes gene_type:complete